MNRPIGSALVFSAIFAGALFTSTRADAGGPTCINVCTASVAGQLTCLTLNMGCNPVTHVCGACINDNWCTPGGTCVGGSCINVLCGLDGGVTPADSGVAADGGLADGSVTDGASGDAADDGGSTAADSGSVDTGSPLQDAGAPADSGAVIRDTGPKDAAPPGLGGGGYTKKEDDDEGCGCRAAPGPAAPSAWVLLGFALILGARRRR